LSAWRSLLRCQARTTCCLVSALLCACHNMRTGLCAGPAGAGHCPQDDAPLLVNPAILRFVERHSGEL